MRWSVSKGLTASRTGFAKFYRNASDEEPNPLDIHHPLPSKPASADLRALLLFQASPPPKQALHVFCRNGSCGPRPPMPVFSQEHSFAERVINQNLGPNETSDRTLTVTERTQAPLSGNERQEQGSRCPTQRGASSAPPFPLFPPVFSPPPPPFLYHSYRIPDCCGPL